MKRCRGFILAIILLLSACQPAKSSVTILADGQVFTLATAERVPNALLAKAGISLGADDRLLYLGSSAALDSELPKADSYILTVRRAVTLTVVTADETRTFQSSALTVGQALEENGYTLYAVDRLDPPAETPLDAALTVAYQAAQEIVVAADGTQVHARSAAQTVGQALTEVGIPLVGLDYAVPSEEEPLPADGKIRVVRVVESIALTQKSIPYSTRTEPSADLELDQQALLQGGEPGLSISRQRTRSEDGVQVAQSAESESIVRPPQDRILGYGTKITIRTTEVDGVSIEYYRAVRVYVTSYSPCRSATPDGSCAYGTSSGLPVQRGTVAMVYSWYLAFGFDRLYIPGYGYATVGDVGGGAPAGNHYWVDLAWSEEEWASKPDGIGGWKTIYFLTPVPQNIVYVLP